jgi:hypothetical protein
MPLRLDLPLPRAQGIIGGGRCTFGPKARASTRRILPCWLGCIPACRATAETLAPGSSVAATSCSSSIVVQCRRRSTDVTT